MGTEIAVRLTLPHSGAELETAAIQTRRFRKDEP